MFFFPDSYAMYYFNYSWKIYLYSKKNTRNLKKINFFPNPHFGDSHHLIFSKLLLQRKWDQERNDHDGKRWCKIDENDHDDNDGDD